MLPTLSSRREWLATAGTGFGALALNALLAADKPTATGPLAERKPHFAPKAKSVIFLFMEGGPSHLDTFDPKPLMNKLAGKPLPPKNQDNPLKGSWKGRRDRHIEPDWILIYGRADDELRLERTGTLNDLF